MADKDKLSGISTPTGPVPSSRTKLQYLARMMRQETECFAKTLSAQIRTLAYVNGILSQSTTLVFEEQPEFYSCLDFTKDSQFSAMFCKKEVKFQDNRVADASYTNSEQKDKAYKPPPSPERQRAYISVRFDALNNFWLMDVEGTVYHWETPLGPLQGKKPPHETVIQRASAPMVPFLGKMLRTDLNKRNMACKISNAAIVLYQLGQSDRFPSDDCKIFDKIVPSSSYP